MIIASVLIDGIERPISFITSLESDHRNLTFVSDSVSAMVVYWKLATIQYDFDIEHIAGVKNVVADLLSGLVENQMKDHPDQFENSLVLSAITNGFISPDDPYDEIVKVHNSLAGHAV